MSRSKSRASESTGRAHKSHCAVCHKVIARGKTLCEVHGPHVEREKCSECGRVLHKGHCPAGVHVSIGGHLVRPIK